MTNVLSIQGNVNMSACQCDGVNKQFVCDIYLKKNDNRIINWLVKSYQ